VPQIRKSKKLPWTPSQMFDLVADVEKYPQFLPWCANGKLVSRNEHELVGTITAQKGAFHKSFTTRNRFDYPHWMDIALVEGPFRHLRGRWEFVATDDGGCEPCNTPKLGVTKFIRHVVKYTRKSLRFSLA